MILGILLLCLLPVILILALGHLMVAKVLLSVLMLPILLLLLESFHAAYTTEYRIEGDAVRLRCGWIMNRRVPFSEIQSVMPVKRIKRVLGWNPGALGYCNRFTNGLLLITKKHAISVSPSDVEAFRAALPAFDESKEIPSELVMESLWIKRFSAWVFIVGSLPLIALAIPMIAGIVPPNGAYGVRTTATLASADIWYPANRVGGECILGAGVAMLLGSLLLLVYARKLHSLAISLIGAGWTVFCVLAALFFTATFVDTLENGPFVSDPEVIGQWKSVDFVPSVEDFQPGEQLFAGDLYLKELTFKPNGKTSGIWYWSKGFYWHPDEKRKGHYEIRTLNGTKYLFLEWLSGDVLLRGQPPEYYVLTPANTPS